MIWRIGPAATSPRAQEQFPYAIRAGHEAEDRAAIRRELDLFFRQNMGLFLRIVRSRTEHLQDADRDDILQQVLIHLTERAVGRFDQSHGVRLQTYLWRCAVNHVRGQINKLNNRPPHIGVEDSFAGPDKRCDRAIEQLAAAIIADPQKFFRRKAQAAVVIDALTYPDSMVRDRAKRLGYQQDSSASMAMLRARLTIARLAEEVA